MSYRRLPVRLHRPREAFSPGSSLANPVNAARTACGNVYRGPALGGGKLERAARNVTHEIGSLGAQRRRQRYPTLRQRSYPHLLAIREGVALAVNVSVADATVKGKLGNETQRTKSASSRDEAGPLGGLRFAIPSKPPLRVP